MISDRFKALPSKALWLILPTFPRVLVLNQKISDMPNNMDFDAYKNKWQQFDYLDDVRPEILSIVYQQAMDRASMFESKAMGLIQACGLVVAAAIFVCTGSFIEKTLGVVGLIYVIFSAWACCLIVLPRARHVVQLQHLERSGKGLPEMAASVEMMTPKNIRSSNLLTAAIYDLARASTVTVLALLLFVFLPDASFPNPTQQTTTSTTETTAVETSTVNTTEAPLTSETEMPATRLPRTENLRGEQTEDSAPPQ